MKCPIDSAVLQMSNREGIEIDYCPTCRGVWLDRGELDKIIERNSNTSTVPNVHQSAHPAQHSGYDDEDNYRRNESNSYNHHKRRKKSFLDDIFDF